MKKFLVFVVIALICAVIYRQTRQTPLHLPLSLVQIECQQNSKYIAPQGFDYYEAGGFTIFSPCTKPGSAREYAKEQARQTTSMNTPAAEARGMINFKIKNDGKSTVAMTDDASDIYPKIADTDYTVSAFWSMDEGKPFDRTITQSDKLEVPSPSVFSETGATTTFYCKGLNSLIDNCWASARSGPLFWRIHIVYGVPKVARMPEDGIAAAYQLIADHLAKQAPKL